MKHPRAVLTRTILAVALTILAVYVTIDLKIPAVNTFVTRIEHKL